MTVYPQIRTSADLLKSTIRLEELIPFLQLQRAEACAMVNTKLYGLLPFYVRLKKASIHPVIGLYVRVQFKEQQSLPLVLYARDNDGYQNLLKISSSIEIRDDGLLPWKWLVGYSKGCVAVIPAIDEEGIWVQTEVETYAMQLVKVFQSHLFVAIARPGGVISMFEDQAIQLSEKLQCPIIATHESLFLHQQDSFAYDVLRCIDKGIKVNEYTELGVKKDQYVPTRDEWLQWFHDKKEWLQNSQSLLLNCKVELKFDRHFMPKYPLMDHQNSKDILYQLAWKGLKERLQTNHPNETYVKRLEKEIGIICSMGYADYFLIVADFMDFARKNQILTGPGRGSSASSLVAYCLYITQIDPIPYGLLFERFLNPERVTLPDIDIDFVDTRRNEMIDYVAKKYGKQRVAQIITFGTLSAKAVARDVARMFDFDRETIGMISKFIPNKMGITLKQVYQHSKMFREWVESEPIRKQWFSIARKLEGLPRNASTHAAGVVLSPKPLVEVIPIEKGHDGIFLTQWPMQEVEQIGLLKMDFLGLRNLTIIDQIQKSIFYTHHIHLDLRKIPLNDDKTFQLLQEGDTVGVFQLESHGMKRALVEMVPNNFLDIVAVIALYRPGPMEFISVYARRKKGLEPVRMPHPVLEPILNETYGIIVYQEQIMQIANVLANFTMGQADLLRRAVSKKKREILEEQRSLFVTGAVNKGFSKKIAEDVYSLIVRFADYGFAKSHAVAYSVISYQMAFLKANYPVNFYATLMTSATGNQEKLFQLILEARSKGIEILPPSILKSRRFFVVEKGKIRFSLSAIKGVSQPFLQKLMAIRKQRTSPFEDIFDVAISLSAVYFQRKNIEPLVKAGAFDDFGMDRATLLATIDAAEEHAKFIRPNEEVDLFTSQEFLFGKPKYAKVEPIPEKVKLQFEKEVFGFYLSEHPVSLERKKYTDVHLTTGSLKHIQPNSYIKMVGVVESIRQIRTKKGELMAFILLQDEFGTISATLFPQIYQRVMEGLKEEQMVYIEGIFEIRNGKPTIKVKYIKYNLL